MYKNCKNHVLIMIGLLTLASHIIFAQDSTQFDTQSIEKKSPLKRLIAPVALIATGLFIHQTNGSINKYKIQDKIQDKFAINSSADDYVQYYPFAAFLTLKALKQRGANNSKDQFFLLAKSQILMGGLVYFLKIKSQTPRPDGAGGTRSFPSGHTSMSFAAASFLYNEYRDTHKAVAWSGYALATTTGMMRVMNDEHWMSDIVFGAGLGILCNELVYMHHNRTRRNNKKETASLVILPRVSHAKLGFTLDYKF